MKTAQLVIGQMCFVLFYVFVIVQAILLWCTYAWPCLHSCNIFYFNMSSIYIQIMVNERTISHNLVLFYSEQIKSA